MLSIHSNLSADAQNITGAYVIIMLVNNALTCQSSCVIANNAQKTAKAMKKHRATKCYRRLRNNDVIKYKMCHCN